MDKTAVLIHGWNVRDKGARTVDTLGPHLERGGWTVDKDSADYGFIFWMMFSFIGRIFFAKKLVKRLVPAIAKADLIVDHSNGGNFSTKALKLLGGEHLHTKVVVHISPAMNKKTDIPSAVKAQLVMHTRYDKATRLAAYIPFSPWGSMGTYGYMGFDVRNTNLDRTNTVKGHSGHFHGLPMQRKTAETVIQFYEENKI